MYEYGVQRDVINNLFSRDRGTLVGWVVAQLVQKFNKIAFLDIIYQRIFILERSIVEWTLSPPSGKKGQCL
jgi:hypothetical protein